MLGIDPSGVNLWTFLVCNRPLMNSSINSHITPLAEEVPEKVTALLSLDIPLAD